MTRDGLDEDQDIDLTDIPEVDEAWFARARIVTPVKTARTPGYIALLALAALYLFALVMATHGSP